MTDYNLKQRLREFWWNYRGFIVFGGVLVALLIAGLIAMFSPYCTQWSDGGVTCSQLVWGGRKIWHE